MATQNIAAGVAVNELDKCLCCIRMTRCFHDRGRVNYLIVKIILDYERDPYAVASDLRVRRVNDSGIDFASDDVFKDLPDIFSKNEPRSQRFCESGQLKRLLSVLPCRDRLWISDSDPRDVRS